MHRGGIDTTLNICHFVAVIALPGYRRVRVNMMDAIVNNTTVNVVSVSKPSCRIFYSVGLLYEITIKETTCHVIFI